MFGLAWLAQQWAHEFGELLANPGCRCSHCEAHRGKVWLALHNHGGGMELLRIEAGR